MKAITARAAMATLVAAATMVVGTGIVSAHETACEIRLREAPIETAELPEGWAWDFFTVERYGAPAFEAAIDAGGFAVNLTLTCASDPEGLFDRLEDLRVVAGNDKIGVVPIGDESMAAREFSDFPTIRWRHEDIIGQLRGCDRVDYGAMEAFALRVDELLPSTEQ